MDLVGEADFYDMTTGYLTINSHVNEKLLRCHTDMGLSRDDLVVLARNSFLGSVLPADQARHWVDAVDAYATASTQVS